MNGTSFLTLFIFYIMLENNAIYINVINELNQK